MKSSEGGRLLSDKRTQVLEVGDLSLDLDSGVTIGNLENLQLFPRNWSCQGVFTSSQLCLTGRVVVSSLSSFRLVWSGLIWHLSMCCLYTKGCCKQYHNYRMLHCRDAGGYFKVQTDARSLCQMAALLRKNHTAITVGAPLGGWHSRIWIHLVAC